MASIARACWSFGRGEVNARALAWRSSCNICKRRRASTTVSIRIAATCRQEAGNEGCLPYLGESTPDIYGFSRSAAMAIADQHLDQHMQQEIIHMPSTNTGGWLVYASSELAWTSRAVDGLLLLDTRRHIGSNNLGPSSLVRRELGISNSFYRTKSPAPSRCRTRVEHVESLIDQSWKIDEQLINLDGGEPSIGSGS